MKVGDLVYHSVDDPAEVLPYRVVHLLDHRGRAYAVVAHTRCPSILDIYCEASLAPWHRPRCPFSVGDRVVNFLGGEVLTIARTCYKHYVWCFVPAAGGSLLACEGFNKVGD